MKQAFRKGQQITAAANTAAVLLAQGLTPAEENVLGNLFTLVGASLLSIAAIDETTKQSQNSSQATASE